MNSRNLHQIQVTNLKLGKTKSRGNKNFSGFGGHLGTKVFEKKPLIYFVVLK